MYKPWPWYTSSGEFGSVYKARLKQKRSAETIIVAVKTMKGTVIILVQLLKFAEYPVNVSW